MTRQFILLSVILVLFIVFYSVFYYTGMNMGDRIIKIETDENSNTKYVLHKLVTASNENNFIFSAYYLNELNRLKYNLYQHDTMPAIFLADTINLQNDMSIGSERFLSSSGVLSSEYKNDLIEILDNRFESVETINFEKFEYGIFEYFNFKEVIIRSFYLYKNEFKFNDKPVRAFFYRPDRREVPADILYYENPDDFAISLELTQTNERAVMAVLPQLASLEEMYQYVLNNASLREAQTPGMNDRIIIPVLNFDLLEISENSTESNGIMQNEELSLLSMRRIRFLLSVKQKDFSLLPSRRIELRDDEEVSRRMYFNRPFLFFITDNEHKNEPYFILWVGEVELMNEN